MFLQSRQSSTSSRLCYVRSTQVDGVTPFQRFLYSLHPVISYVAGASPRSYLIEPSQSLAGYPKSSCPFFSEKKKKVAILLLPPLKLPPNHELVPRNQRCREMTCLLHTILVEAKSQSPDSGARLVARCRLMAVLKQLLYSTPYYKIAYQ